ncbi:SDR family NAD(P)-dependent oxidoreductase [Xanthobacter sp. DSM 24535]|uniref:SDR family NAD(P)-dependent oxidoreductase n=1 Tax=Roseixanthobacter psychrophilus TaxID=3119917 RepID=UPI003727E90A
MNILDSTAGGYVPAFNLTGKRALVSGAGRGIGLASARTLAAMGAHVTLAARSADEITAAADEIIRDGGSADTLTLDVSAVETIPAALERHAPYDILVNNAGTNRTKPFLDVPVEDFDVIMGLNVRAAYFMAQAVARGMVAAGRGGSIIHMSSQMGHVGAATRTVYCASKWAMEGMSKAMAVDLAPYGIRVNTLCPTFIETPLSGNFLSNPAFRAEVLSKIKLGRIGKVEDLIGAVVFLASDASALMTGASLVIDGGWTAD